MTQTNTSAMRDRLKASALHLLISLAIAALAGLLVFTLWYPGAYRETSGGRELFLLLVTVDVIIGPLCTFAVFNRAKPSDVLVRDLAVVGLVQLAALAYGLWAASVARPVHLVFDHDRFQVVHAIEVPQAMLRHAPSDLRELPLTGPTIIALRPFRDASEKSAATLMALSGLPLSARPDLWQAYPMARQRVLAAAKPAAELRQRFAQQTSEIDVAVRRTGRPLDKLAYVPMVARDSFWTVLLDADSLEVCGFIPLDSF